MTSPTPTELLIQVLAARRLARLAVVDEIARPLRERAAAVHPLIDELLSCEHCAAVHAAALVPLLPRRLRVLLAVAGGASLLIELSSLPHRYEDA
jgi:hypothetical protein